MGKIGPRFNTDHSKLNYALIDEQGKVIEKFRILDTVLAWKSKLEKEYWCKLKIVKLK